VGNVARHIGYESSSAFVAAFRHETGLTPATFVADTGGRAES
jgi:AraC-like DNA-binding protein